MFLFVSLLFNNLISKGIFSIIYKFNLFLIARKMSIHFTNPPESTVQSFSGSVGLSPQDVIISHLYRFIYFILIQNAFISFTLYNFKHFIYFDFIITIYPIYSVNSVIPWFIPFKHLFQFILLILTNKTSNNFSIARG